MLVTVLLAIDSQCMDQKKKCPFNFDIFASSALFS